MRRIPSIAFFRRRGALAALFTVWLSGFALLGPVAAQAAGEAEFQNGQEAFAKGDYPATADHFRKAAQKGHVQAGYTLGLLYSSAHKIPENKTEALKWMRMSAEQGFAPAQQELGLWYLAGRYVPRDPAEAARWLRKAADGGDKSAMYFLGAMYAKGRGVEKNTDWALRWFKHAAALGFPVPAKYLSISGVEQLGRSF